MLSPEEELFGRIAIDLGLVSEEQLSDAKEQTREGRGARLLGRVLLDLGYLDDAGHERIRRDQRDPMRKLRRTSVRLPREDRYSALAISRGLIDVDDLLIVLEEQERLKRGKLLLTPGEILVQHGKLTPAQHQELLAELADAEEGAG